MKNMKNAQTLIVVLCACALAATLFALTGCSSQSAGDGSQASSADATQANDAADEPADYTVDTYPLNLMDQLLTAKTPEEANEIIGSEGELVETTENPASAVTVTETVYKWDLGDDVTIEGEFTTNDGEGDSYRDSEFATYEIDFPSSRLSESQLADFANWSEIKAQHEAGTLDYAGLVELLGGVPGIKKEVSTKDSYEYYWYNADGGYLSVGSGPAGKLGIALSGKF